MPETRGGKKKRACEVYGRKGQRRRRRSDEHGGVGWGRVGWGRVGVDLVFAEAAGVTDSLKKFSSRGELHHDGNVSGGEKKLTGNGDGQWGRVRK